MRRETGLIDILLPLGPDSQHRNAETRYALRSICKYAKGWRRVVIVGKDPNFLSEDNRVTMIPRPEFNGFNKEARIALKLQWAFENVDMTSHVAFWNDDFVLNQEIDVREIPFHRRSYGLMEPKCTGRYREAELLTGRLLYNAGRPSDFYDIHTPIVYQKDRYTSLAWWWRKSKLSHCGLLVKSVYANNFLDEPGPVLSDCKFRGSTFNKEVAQRRYLFSYNSEAMKGTLGKWLKELFPEPCPLENR